jgi:hypothetical protein
MVGLVAESVVPVSDRRAVRIGGSDGFHVTRRIVKR